MPQPVTISGTGAAVGSAIESAWGNVPISVAGVPRTIGNVASPHRFATVQPTGGLPPEATIDIPKNELDGAISPIRSILTAKKYAGDFSLLADPEGLYNFLLALCGRDVQTTITAAASNGGIGVLQHVIKLGRTAPSLTVEEQFVDGSGRLTSGNIVTTGDFTFGAEISAKFGMQGKRAIPNDYKNATLAKTSYNFGTAGNVLPGQMGGDGVIQIASTPVPTYVDVSGGQNGNGPLVWAGLGFGSQAAFAGAYLTMDGVALPNATFLQGSSLGIKRDVQFDMVSGSEFDIGTSTSSAVTAMGKLNFIYADATIPAAHLAHRTFGLNLKFSGVQIGASASNYALEIYIPKFKLTKAPVPLTDKELLISCDIDLYMDRTVGSLVVLTLTNTFDNTGLAGAFASAPGGLGGWLAA